MRNPSVIQKGDLEHLQAGSLRSPQACYEVMHDTVCGEKEFVSPLNLGVSACWPPLKAASHARPRPAAPPDQTVCCGHAMQLYSSAQLRRHHPFLQLSPRGAQRGSATCPRSHSLRLLRKRALPAAARPFQGCPGKTPRAQPGPRGPPAEAAAPP